MFIYIIILTSWDSSDVGVFLYSCSIIGGLVFFGGYGVHGQGDEYLWVERIKINIILLIKYILILPYVIIIIVTTNNTYLSFW
jgi:hypothetical protein